MPGLVRKLAVIAAAGGLILQPLSQRNQRASAPFKIDYNTHQLAPLEQEAKERNVTSASLEAHGIVGRQKSNFPSAQELDG